MSEPISDPSPERAARNLHEGTAHGGPLDGKEVTSRFWKGVVAIDMPAGKAWIYDYTPASESEPARFTVREADGRTLDEERRWHAAEGGDFDVLAVA